MIQEVKGKPLSGGKGFLLILLLVVGLYALSILLTLLKGLIGYTAASISLWAVGVLVAFFLMYRYVLGYRYELDGTELGLGRMYGKHVRFMDQVSLRNAIACGTVEEMRTRYPQARLVKAVKPSNSLPVMAVAFKCDEMKIVCLQPNDGIRGELLKAVKEK